MASVPHLSTVWLTRLLHLFVVGMDALPCLPSLPGFAPKLSLDPSLSLSSGKLPFQADGEAPLTRRWWKDRAMPLLNAGRAERTDFLC